MCDILHKYQHTLIVNDLVKTVQKALSFVPRNLSKKISDVIC
jgi:hypothetical protein